MASARGRGWRSLLSPVLGEPRRGPQGLAFEGTEFQLRLNGDWRQVLGDDPEQFRFTSDEKRTVVVISTLPVRLPPSRLLEVAKRLGETRRKEEQSVPGRKVTFGDSGAELRDDGELGHVAYAGYDDHGTIFRFMGWATEAKLLSLWVSTETTDNALSKRIFEEVFAGFRFYVP